MKTKAAIVWSAGKPLSTMPSLAGQFCLYAQDLLRAVGRAFTVKASTGPWVASCAALAHPPLPSRQVSRRRFLPQKHLSVKALSGKTSSCQGNRKEASATLLVCADHPFWLRPHDDDIPREQLLISVADSLLQFNYDTLPIRGTRK